jgi:hypothetical protein
MSESAADRAVPAGAITCTRCGATRVLSPTAAAVLQRLPSTAPFVCAKCAVDGKGSLRKHGA